MVGIGWLETGGWDQDSGTLGMLWTQYHTCIQFKEPANILCTCITVYLYIDCIMYHMKSTRADVKSILIDSHWEDVSCLAGKCWQVFHTELLLQDIQPLEDSSLWAPGAHFLQNQKMYRFCLLLFDERRLCDFWHCFRCKSPRRCSHCPGSCFLWWLCPEACRSAAEIHGYHWQSRFVEMIINAVRVLNLTKRSSSDMLWHRCIEWLCIIQLPINIKIYLYVYMYYIE